MQVIIKSVVRDVKSLHLESRNDLKFTQVPPIVYIFLIHSPGSCQESSQDRGFFPCSMDR